MCIAVNSSAQASVNAGYLYQSLKEKEKSTSYSLNLPFHGFYVGVDYGIKIGKVFSIVPGLYYEFGQCTKLFNLIGDYGNKWNEHYLKIPVDFKFGFGIGRKSRFFFAFGPKLHIGLASKISNGVESVDMYKAYKELSEGASYSRADVLVGLNTGVDIGHVRIKVGYDYGLVDRGRKDSVKSHNNLVQVGLAYIF